MAKGFLARLLPPSSWLFFAAAAIECHGVYFLSTPDGVQIMFGVPDAGFAYSMFVANALAFAYSLFINRAAGDRDPVKRSVGIQYFLYNFIIVLFSLKFVLTHDKCPESQPECPFTIALITAIVHGVLGALFLRYMVMSTFWL